MDPVEEFSNTLTALLSVKPPGVSGTKIRKLTELAVQNVQSEAVLVQNLYAHIKQSPPTHKLGALYVVDSIARAYQDEAAKLQQTVGPSAPEGTFAAGLYRITLIILNIMSDVFTLPPSDDIKVCFLCFLCP